jgi:ATPases involved in chromosome partitioning
MNNQGIVSLVIADYDTSRLMRLREGLQQNPILRVVGVAQSGNDAINRASSLAADAVLMEYSMIDCTAIDVCQKLKDDSPGTSVFVITDSLNAQLVFSAKRAGIIEVFSRQGLVEREVGTKITQYVYQMRDEWNNLAQTHGTVEKGTGPLGQKIVKEYITKSIPQSIILTYNTKGGVGKSSTAINLALAIKMSPYISGQRVALVDFDCGGANVSTLCHIPDSDAINRNLISWEYVNDKITPQEIDDLMIEGPHGLMVLPAPLNIVAAEKINFELCDKIIGILKRFFPIIIIDGAPNISASMDAALRHATHVLLIANGEGQSVKQLSRTISILSPDPDFPDKPDYKYLLNKMFVVLNHAQGYSKWDLEPLSVAKTIGIPMLAELPFSETVRQALHGDSEKQAIELEPNGEYANAIKQLANNLVGAYPEGVENGYNRALNKKEHTKGGLFGFLKKIR